MALAPPALALALPSLPAAQVLNVEGQVDPFMGGDLALYNDQPQVANISGWYVRVDVLGEAHSLFEEGVEIPPGFVFDPDFDGV